MYTRITVSRVTLTNICCVFLFCGLGLRAIEGKTCSDVILPVDPIEGQVVSARTLDFSLVDETILTAVTMQAFERNRTWHSDWQGLGNGKEWTNRYGFVGMHALGQVTRLLGGRVFNLDGLNEAGLSAAFLWLEEAGYPSTIPARSDRSVSMIDTVNYILGMFRTVDEVVAALTDPQDPNYVEIFGLPLISALVPLHVVVHDAAGRSLVIEWVKGTQHLYTGQDVDAIGVLTNDPPYPEQVRNLREHYSSVTPDNALLGIPGDASFRSRFVRLAKLRQFAHLTRGSDIALNSVQVAAHLINNVDVVYGTNREPVGGEIRIDDYTGPTLIRDHAKGILYFKGHNNQSYRKIDLARVDFTKRHTKGILADPQPTDSIYDSYQVAQDVTPLLNSAELDWDGSPWSKQILKVHIPGPEDEPRTLATGSMFIHARAPDGRLYQWVGKSWIAGLRYGRLMVPCYVGPLSSKTFRVELDSLPLAEDDKPGTRIYAGFGSSSTEMLLNQRLRQVYVLDAPEE